MAHSLSDRAMASPGAMLFSFSMESAGTVDSTDSLSDLSSRLSSPMSRSPSPPSHYNYPSPPSSQLSSAGSPQPESDEFLSVSIEDESRPAKRRKIRETMSRETRHLDLHNLTRDPSETQKVELERLLKTLRKKRKIVVVAGAGISTSAGVPDFRSSNGLFNSLKRQHNLKTSGKQLFDAAVYKDDISTSSFHDMVRSLSHLTKSAQPTPFHHLLARLAQEGRLLRLYSQNVDGIDTALPPLATDVPLGRKGPWPKTIQLHGGLEKMICTKCHTLSDFRPDLFDGPVPPACDECKTRDHIRTELESKRSHGVGRLRPRMVLYNEHNPDDEAIGAVTRADLKTRPDAVIVVGTTLKVPGVKRIVREMCKVVKDRRDGLTVWINNDAEPVLFENCWDLVVRGTCDEVAHLAALKRWDDDEIGEFKEVSPDEVLQSKEKTGVLQVVLDSRSKSLGVNGLPTPICSPFMSPAPKLKGSMLESSYDGTLTPRKIGLTQASKSFSKLLQSGNIALSRPPPQKRAVLTNTLAAAKKSHVTNRPAGTKKVVAPKRTAVKAKGPASKTTLIGKKSSNLSGKADISNAFKVSKPSSSNLEANGKSKGSRAGSPTKKLRMDSIRSPSKPQAPMVPISDVDERLNNSPRHKSIRFPNLKGGPQMKLDFETMKAGLAPLMT